MRLFGATSASIAMIEAGLITRASAARDFIWATTGGSWGEHQQDLYVKQGNFDAIAKVKSSPAFQLETITASKIIAAKGNTPYDVSNHGEAEVVMLREAGLILPYKNSLMPNYADVYDTAKMDDYYVSTNFLLFGLVWNQKEIKQQPKSFEECLKAEYKGKVGIPAYGWYGMYWLHGVNKALGGTEDNMDPGLKYSADLVKNNGAIIIENADHGKKLFQQGEIVISPFWSGIASQLARAGTPTKFEAVPGSLALGTGFLILKGTPYEEAANQFVNLSLDPKLQVQFASWNNYPPTNKKAVMPAGFEDIRVTEEQLANTVRLDWAKVVANKAKYLKRWNEEVLG
jgi:putative spermidine/putrescine transport system substrate-binding protein